MKSVDFTKTQKFRYLEDETSFFLRKKKSLITFCKTPPFPHLSCRLQPPSPMLFLLLYFFGWTGDCTTFDVLFYLVILWIYLCCTLVHLYQKEFYVWFMQQGIKFTEVWHIMGFFAGTLIWYHTHTKTHGTLRASRLHTHINIYLHQLLCAHSSYLYVYCTEWITDVKKKFPRCVFFSNIRWLDAIRLGSSVET